MSVIGLDIGNENCVIAVARQRGIDVLLNDESNRENPSVVCFGEKQRFLGAAGAAFATMHPKSTVTDVKRLIGRNYSDPDVQDELKMLPFETSVGEDGSVLIHLQYLGEKHSFTPVQIMAMLFSHLKEIAEKNLEMPVLYCVVSIPSYFSDLQRRAYLSAAKIAGLKPVRLMHDCTSTALCYGIYKTEYSKAGPTTVAFVDIGHCDTQVSIVSFEPGHMRIMSHAFDSSLGGRDFDEVLFSYFATQFKEQYKIDVYSNVRACLRLRAACEKLKKVLSANLEAPLNIECLMDEKDVKGSIRREEFERMASELLDRITVPCKKALSDAGIPIRKITSVELVGSGSRIPAISKLLASQFGREPSRTLNASECVARGCALQCAMLSPIFRVRDYEVQDSFPFSIVMSSDGEVSSHTSAGIVFPRGRPFPSIKVLTLQRNDTFHLEAFYANSNELPPGVLPKISSFTIGPFDSSTREKARVKVKVALDLHGIVTVNSAKLLGDHTTDSIGRGITPSEMDHADVDGDVPMMQSSPNGEVKAHTRLDIPISEIVYGGITQAELLKFQEKEINLAQHDRSVEQAKNQKNALESYVYETRSKLFNTYMSFTNDEEREGISKSLQETEDWLYEDGDDETENAYISKLQDLKKLVDPIEERYKDVEERALAAKDLLNCIVEYRMSAESMASKVKEQLIDECNKAEVWLREKTKHQESLPKNTDPILWSWEIRSRTEDLKSNISTNVLQDLQAILRRDASPSDSGNPDSIDER